MIARQIATLGPIGHLRPAPGTWGSLAALPLAWGLHSIGGFGLFFVATLLVSALGIWVIRDATAGQTDHDPSEIVIDEVAGQWIALWPVSFGAVFADTSVLALWPGILVAFLAFRAFDIWKPGPVGWADRMETPTGVMLDDLIAGWLATMVVVVAGVLWHAVLI